MKLTQIRSKLNAQKPKNKNAQKQINKKLAQNIRLIALDVDGTLNNGDIILSQNGEVRIFNVKDGLGIVAWRRLGGLVAIITGRSGELLEKRAKELGIDFLEQNCHQKGQKLAEICERAGLLSTQCAAIGDDANDLSMFKAAAMAFAPKDAAKCAKKAAHKVLKKRGGKGAVREMIDYLLKKQNKQWDFLELYNAAPSEFEKVSEIFSNTASKIDSIKSDIKQSNPQKAEQ